MANEHCSNLLKFPKIFIAAACRGINYGVAIKEKKQVDDVGISANRAKATRKRGGGDASEEPQ